MGLMSSKPLSIDTKQVTFVGRNGGLRTMHTKKACDEFLMHCKQERHLSENSIAAYRQDGRVFPLHVSRHGRGDRWRLLGCVFWPFVERTSPGAGYSQTSLSLPSGALRVVGTPGNCFRPTLSGRWKSAYEFRPGFCVAYDRRRSGPCFKLRRERTARLALGRTLRSRPPGFELGS